MARPVAEDNLDGKTKRPVVYEVVVENLAITKTGFRVTYSHTITNPGAEEFFAKQR